MASAKIQKPTNEEHKFSQKISEVTAWGGKVFGHKQQNQAVAKHCTTCQCSPPKNTKPASTATPKKEHANTISIKDIKSGVSTLTKKIKKEEQASTVHKDAKHTSCIELKKKDKQHTANVQTKDFKHPVGAEMKMKEKTEHQAKGNKTNACNTTTNKEHKDEPTSHYFSNMADHWKEKIMMIKKPKDGKPKDTSSDSDSEEESIRMRETNNKHSKGTKTTSK